MSRSYHTDKPEIIAKRNIDNNSQKSALKIIERKLKNNDVHPLSKKLTITAINRVPIEYLYGLKRIEMRQRQTNEIGNPFATYLTDEKAIILYSLPLKWELEYLDSNTERSLLKFHADIKRGKNRETTVIWNDKKILTLWYYSSIFCHELGHHFCNQYRQKVKSGSYLHEEIVADLQAERLTKYFFDSLKNEREGINTN